MAITVDSSNMAILVNIKDNKGPFVLQRAFYKSREWKTWTVDGFVIIPENQDEIEEKVEALTINEGVFIDSFELEDGLYEYRYISSLIDNPKENDYIYSQWVKYGMPDTFGYSFGNYKSPQGEWGEVLTPDDCRYTYLWGTDLKSTNGSYFSDEQIKWFVSAALEEVERRLNISIKKRRIKSQYQIEKYTKDIDYDEEEAVYDFSFRKIQRYGMIQTKKRPILNVKKCILIKRGESSDIDLTSDIIPDKKQGILKFLKRPFIASDTRRGISTAISKYGQETFQPNLFYAIDYDAGFEKAEDVPTDLRQIIGKVAAVSLLNVIGDGLMAGFSSSSLSMDGISESFSSTQSATSAYFGARIAEYKKDLEDYYEKNRYRFNNYRLGTL